MKKRIQEMLQKRKKKKGFTLIELLAVIVVLAIIVLIATPIVMNVIKDSKKGATERSAERYLDAVETAIATDRLQNALVADGIYRVDANGNLTLGEKNLTVEVSGDRPKEGSAVAIKNGQVVPIGTEMLMGIYTVTIDDRGKATAEETRTICVAIASIEQPLWNVADQVMKSKVVGVQATKDNPYAKGAVYSCNLGDGARTFYVLRTVGDNVRLIMDQNIGDQVTWCLDVSYDIGCGADGAKAHLISQTSGWTKLASVGGNVDLLSAIYDVSTISPPDWIRINLGETVSGYWTGTSYSGYPYDSAYVVQRGSYEEIIYTKLSNSFGVRPVITIPKDEMSL